MPHKYTYTISENGFLLIADRLDNTPKWQGRFFELNVISVLPLPTSDDCIVLLDWRMAEKRAIRNLIRCNANGEVVWIVGPPIEPLKSISRKRDVYDYVELKGEILQANSLESFLDNIDIETGEVVKSIFVK